MVTAQIVTRPLTVLFPFVGDSIGGSHISALTLADALREKGARPILALHSQSGPLRDHVTALGWEPVLLPETQTQTLVPFRRALPGLLQETPSLARAIRKSGTQIVHTNDIRMHQLWGLASRLSGAKHLWHQRTPTRSRRLTSYARLSHRLLTISRYCQSELSSSLGSRALIVPNPVAQPDPPPDRKVARERLLGALEQAHSGPIVGYLSNLTERKRPDFFIEIAAQLTAEGLDARFPMIGAVTNDDRDRLESRIDKAGLSGRCHLLGPRLPAEPWLAGFDVLIAPARREAWGRTLVEAMAVGTSVVASAEGGHCEILTDEVAGHLCDPDSVGAFAKAVVNGLDLSEPCRIHAQSVMRRRFSVSAHVDSMNSHYDALIQRTSFP